MKDRNDAAMIGDTFAKLEGEANARLITITGLIATSGFAHVGIRVVAYDRDLPSRERGAGPQLLGEAIVDDVDMFRIEFDYSRYGQGEGSRLTRTISGTNPDLRFRVYDRSGLELLLRRVVSRAGAFASDDTLFNAVNPVDVTLDVEMRSDSVNAWSEYETLLAVIASRTVIKSDGNPAERGPVVVLDRDFSSRESRAGVCPRLLDDSIIGDEDRFTVSFDSARRLDGEEGPMAGISGKRPFSGPNPDLNLRVCGRSGLKFLLWQIVTARGAFAPDKTLSNAACYVDGTLR